MEEEYMTIDLREIFNLLLRKIGWIILSVFIFGLGGFILNWYVLKPIYQANAMIIVNTREEQNVVVTNDQINSAIQLVNTYGVILKSDTVMEQVLNAMENRGVVAPGQITIAYLKNRISVSSVNSTQVMRISAEDENQEIALAMVDEILTVAPSIIIRTVKAGSVEVVSYPKLNNVPVSPHKLRNLALCVIAGGVIAAGVIILQDMLDSTVKTDEDIRKKLDLPVLGVIPKIRENDLTTKSSDKKSSDKRSSNKNDTEKKGDRNG